MIECINQDWTSNKLVGDELDLSFLYCSLSIYILFCVEVLLSCNILDNSCVASGVVANYIGFVISNCDFDIQIA